MIIILYLFYYSSKRYELVTARPSEVLSRCLTPRPQLLCSAWCERRRLCTDGRGSQASNDTVSYSPLDSPVAAFEKYGVKKEGACRNKKKGWASGMVPWRNVLYPPTCCWRIFMWCSLLKFPEFLGTQNQAQKGLGLLKCWSLRPVTEKFWGCAVNCHDNTEKMKVMKLSTSWFHGHAWVQKNTEEDFVEVPGKLCGLETSGRQEIFLTIFLCLYPRSLKGSN